MSNSNHRPQALVTGGSRGIGKAVCLELAKQGYDIAFTYRSNQNAAKQLEIELRTLGIQAQGYAADIANLTVLEKVLEEILVTFPRIEVLVNNAGISIDGLSMRVSGDQFDQLMQTNVKGAFFTTQALLRPMMKARRGSIIFMSSVIGQMGNAGQTVYATTKSALFGMAKSLAKELGSRGIRVNAIAPGFIETDMTSTLPESHKQSILLQIPLGTLGAPEDIAKVVGFLAGPGSRYITGQVIAVNGGLYM